MTATQQPSSNLTAWLMTAQKEHLVAVAQIELVGAQGLGAKAVWVRRDNPPLKKMRKRHPRPKAKRQYPQDPPIHRHMATTSQRRQKRTNH
jgi:hypothetical protein